METPEADAKEAAMENCHWGLMKPGIISNALCLAQMAAHTCGPPGGFKPYGAPGGVSDSPLSPPFSGKIGVNSRSWVRVRIHISVPKQLLGQIRLNPGLTSGLTLS